MWIWMTLTVDPISKVTDDFLQKINESTISQDLFNTDTSFSQERCIILRSNKCVHLEHLHPISKVTEGFIDNP